MHIYKHMLKFPKHFSSELRSVAGFIVSSVTFYNIFFLDLNDVENLYDGMINQCIDAMKIQYEVDQVLEKNILVESANQNKSSVTPPLFTAEKNLLLLASYPDCTEGILYSMLLLLQSKNTVTLLIRFVSHQFSMNVLKTIVTVITFFCFIRIRISYQLKGGYFSFIKGNV